jgi:hypothetical protein
MKTKIMSWLLAVVVIPVILLSSSGSLFASQNSFKVIVLIVPAKHYKDVYESRYDSYADEDSRSVYDIQDELKDLFKEKTGSHATKGAWDVVLCKTSKEFEEKASDSAAYLCMKVEIEQYKTNYKDTEVDEHVYSELTVNCEIHRRSGTIWSKTFSKGLSSKSTDSNDYEYFVTSVEKMAEYLDAVIMNNMVSYQILSSMSKDARTKEVKAKVMNTSPLPIRNLKWIIPSEKEEITAETTNSIKPGETLDVVISVHSEKSHAAIQWRNTYICDVEFDRNVK